MKTSIILFAALFLLASCQKELVDLPQAPKVASSAVAKINTDTIADHAAFKIKLVKDSINTDETMIIFNKTSHLDYSGAEDALYMQGYGQESLASISHDGRDLVFNNVPYTPGMSIGLDVKVQSDGPYMLQLSYQTKLPANTRIWLKDNYLKDSVNVRTVNYHFNISKTDTNSFGKNRFKLVIRGNGEQ